MGRLAWSQLRFRAARSAALLLGMLLAATAFTVLTAAARTSQLRAIGTVSAHFQPAYDILVRPKGSRTALENQAGTVQPNFLSGSYGGITMAQYHQIQGIVGVSVAAPIAVVGVSLPVARIPVALPDAAIARPGRQLYRVSTTWVSEGRTSRIRQPPSYVYITPDRLRSSVAGGPAAAELLPGGAQVAVCPQPDAGTDPFGIAGQSASVCWSKRGGPGPVAGGQGGDGLTAAHPGFTIAWDFPLLIAAVDPAAEAKLDGLNHAVTSGRYLGQDAGAGSTAAIPVLAASGSGVDEYAQTQVQQLASPARPPSLSLAAMQADATAPGRTVLTTRTTAQQAYRVLLAALRARQAVPETGLSGYWNVGPTSYRRDATGALTPVLVHNPLSVWQAGLDSAPPMDNEDNQYRALDGLAPLTDQFPGGRSGLQLTGIFDPARIRSFDPLSQVPLGPYQPISAAPADAASRNALGGGDLLPNLNLGGYVGQPVNLITTLAALPALQSSGYFSGSRKAGDPISVIRVRVAGVTGPNPVSLERIREVAQQIAVRTGLDVDIVAGSSPQPTTIDLPAGKFGQPALQLTEGWVKLGVAVAILSAVDKKSVLLFTLILVVCVLFVANSATAAVRGRRRELGVLACLGWTRPRLFAVVLGELAAIGLAAGALGAVVALPLSAGLGLRASAGRALLAVPVAVGVAVVAGAVPAWVASRADPVASVRPPAASVRRGRQVAGITGLAVVNVARTPGRTVVGAASLAVGVAALTLLTAVTFAFRGAVVGSLLGDAVAVQVRGVDYVAVTATVLLGVLAVADVMFLNVRERAGELAVIRALGWRESALARLVVTEGAVIGVGGSLAGAALGLAAAAWFAGQLPARLYLAAAAAVAAGVLVTAAVAVLPARMLRRLPDTRLLAQE